MISIIVAKKIGFFTCGAHCGLLRTLRHHSRFVWRGRM